jgi:hypothetical protein
MLHPFRAAIGADEPAEPAEVAAPHTNESLGPAAMMTITKLRGADYLLRSVADGVEDYFMGAGEAPGAAERVRPRTRPRGGGRRQFAVRGG